MPVIKPISDLRNKANEISNLAHESNEPIFITRNGEGDMVVMSIASYSRLQLKLELFGKLAVAQAQRASGDKGRTVSQVMKELRKRIRETAYIPSGSYVRLKMTSPRLFLTSQRRGRKQRNSWPNGSRTA